MKDKEIIDECMRVMPFGNIQTHTPENLPARIQELASALAQSEIENDDLTDVVLQAINILDGNEEPIDWRRGGHELLRKLCEHLETVERKEDED